MNWWKKKTPTACLIIKIKSSTSARTHRCLSVSGRQSRGSGWPVQRVPASGSELPPAALQQRPHGGKFQDPTGLLTAQRVRTDCTAQVISLKYIWAGEEGVTAEKWGQQTVQQRTDTSLVPVGHSRACFQDFPFLKLWCVGVFLLGADRSRASKNMR